MADTKPDPLLTYEGYRVAGALLSDIDAEHTGYDILRHTGVNQGTLYPLLHRWAEAGWLTIRDEKPEEHAARTGRKGRLRRLIQVTELGKEKLPNYFYRWEEKNVR